MSRDEPQLSRSERELEAMFATLKPAAPSFTEAQIAYEAGRRAGRTQVVRWRAAAAILVGALGLLILARPAPRTIEKLVVVQSAPLEAKTFPAIDRQPYAIASPAAPGTYLNLRQAIVERGVDALPRAAAGSGGAWHEDVLRAGSSIDEIRGRL
jgi:hypothetical protein